MRTSFPWIGSRWSAASRLGEWVKSAAREQGKPNHLLGTLTVPLSQSPRNNSYSWRAALIALAVGFGSAGAGPSTLLGAGPNSGPNLGPGPNAGPGSGSGPGPIMAAPSSGLASLAALDSVRNTPTVQAIARALPCVVSVSSEKRAASTSRWPFTKDEDKQPRISGMGTGVIVDQRGYILTNHHVVDKVSGIEIQLHNNEAYPARIIATDKQHDLAILKIEPQRPLQPIAIGTSADLMVGEDVVTIGNAFGYDETVSKGIISALNRSVTLADDQSYFKLIQTDACINPGNSGGAMINIHGELVGINVAVRAGAQGIGFALPIDDVLQVVQEMMSTNRLRRTFHGLAAIHKIVENNRLVVLNEVKSGSPAEKHGFKIGDQVVRVGDYQIRTPLDIERAMLDIQPGVNVPVVVTRNGKEQNLALSVESAPAPSDSNSEIWKALGVKTVPVNNQYVKQAAPTLRGGLWISEVSPGSVAARANFAPGDILVGLNLGPKNWETIRTQDILFILEQQRTSNNTPLIFYLIRKNKIHSGAFDFNRTASIAAANPAPAGNRIR